MASEHIRPIWDLQLFWISIFCMNSIPHTLQSYNFSFHYFWLNQMLKMANQWLWGTVLLILLPNVSNVSTDWGLGSGFTLASHWSECKLLSQEPIVHSLSLPLGIPMQPWDKSGRLSGWKSIFLPFHLFQMFSFHLCTCLWHGLLDSHVHKHQLWHKGRD